MAPHINTARQLCGITLPVYRRSASQRVQMYAIVNIWPLTISTRHLVLLWELLWSTITFVQFQEAFFARVLISPIAPKPVWGICVDLIHLWAVTKHVYANYHLKSKCQSCQPISGVWLLKNIVENYWGVTRFHIKVVCRITLWLSSNSPHLPSRKPKTCEQNDIFNNYRLDIGWHDWHFVWDGNLNIVTANSWRWST